MIVYHGISAPGHVREVITGINATEKFNILLIGHSVTAFKSKIWYKNGNSNIKIELLC